MIILQLDSEQLGNIIENSVRKVLNEAPAQEGGQKTVFNLSELAAYTGWSKSYLYNLTSTGRIPCYKPNGKHLYFNKQEIDDWLLQNRKATNEELDSQAATHVTLKKGGA